jgi:hypothetical protein
MLPRILLMAVLLFPAPGFAFDTTKLGSIALDMDELAAVIKQSPALQREIDTSLAKTGKKPSEEMCDGMRFPGAWPGLAGLRVSPYRCQFGDKWLNIETKVRVTGKHGKVFERIDKTAMHEAENVKETGPIWTWSDTQPSEP